MSQYTPEQLTLYFEHIKYHTPHHATDPLVFITELQKHHLARVPFETLSLHYSVDKVVSLDPQDLFEKIVIKGRGGYCHENNRFFSEILRSVGFQVINVICRISHATRGIPGEGWRAMSHMANIVTVNSARYLVDVGYGADGPPRPLPLASGRILEGLPGQHLKLEHKKLPQHNDPGQLVWVYSQCRNSGEWMEIYHFVDAEFFPADFEILNYFTMTRSFFTQAVIVQRFILDETGEQKNLSGAALLFRDHIKLRSGSSEETVENLKSEEQRILALKRYFQIVLTEAECSAILGSDSELKC